MSYVNPPVVSEREPGVDEDCVPCAALMLALANRPGCAPATKAEAERLRHAVGYPPDGGVAVEPIAAELHPRYGTPIPKVTGTFLGLWHLLRPGFGAFVIIKPDRFGWDHPFYRYNHGFHGYHCVYVGRKGWRRRVWMIDPEGPKDGIYKGDWVSKSDLAKAFVGSAAVLSLAKR